MDVTLIISITFTAIFSALVTYFITNSTRRKANEKNEREIEKLKEDLALLRRSMVFVVTRLGGNPSEMGLLNK